MGYIATFCIILVAYSVGIQSATFHDLVQNEIAEHNESDVREVGVVVETALPINGGQNQLTGINWNQVVDFILDIAREDIIRLGKSQVDLPDISEEFTKRVLSVKLHGYFKADNGWLKDLSTLQRTADVKVTGEGLKLTITFSVGLGRLELGYNHYQAKIHRVGSVSGHITGAVGRNSIRVTATVDVNEGKCTAILNEVTVVELDGPHIEVSGSGFGPMNWLIAKVTNSYTSKHRNEIILKIQQGLFAAIAKSFKEFHCEQNISVLML